MYALLLLCPFLLGCDEDDEPPGSALQRGPGEDQRPCQQLPGQLIAFG